MSASYTISGSVRTGTSGTSVVRELSGYLEKVADLAAVGLVVPRRRSCDRRIEAACLHLAEVHSMPLPRIVELVAYAIARRARNGARTSGRAKRVVRRRRVHQGPMESASEATYPAADTARPMPTPATPRSSGG